MIAAIASRAFFSNSPVNDKNFDEKGVVQGVADISRVYRFFGVGDPLRVIYPEAEHNFPPDAREAAYQFVDQIPSLKQE
jgi:hypothetical protein